MSYSEEISLLKKESDIPIEELREIYAKMSEGDDYENESNEDVRDVAMIDEQSSIWKHALDSYDKSPADPPAKRVKSSNSDTEADKGEDEGALALRSLEESDTKAEVSDEAEGSGKGSLSTFARPKSKIFTS